MTNSVTMVCFEASGTPYCLPLDATLSVRSADDLVSLPDPAADVAGLIPGEPALTVISPLGAERGHIIVIETAGMTFGLLVDEVTGLQRVDVGDIRPAPHGQARPLVSGTLGVDGQLVFVADPIALAGRL
jgi:chemotaxis signal transduction protein